MKHSSEKPRYRRLLIKISGEALSGLSGFGFDDQSCHFIADQIASVYGLGVEIGVVIGGGNIFRGEKQADRFGFQRVAADYVGLLATTINGMILRQLLETKGCKARLVSSKSIEGIVESYNWVESEHALSDGSIVIFAGGTGNPFFTTDSAAALRACEIQAEVLIKATKVDGVYDRDPHLHSDARRYDHLTYDEVLQKNLKVMDATAISMCRDQHLPIIVCNLFEEGALKELVLGKSLGTRVDSSHH